MRTRSKAGQRYTVNVASGAGLACWLASGGRSPEGPWDEAMQQPQPKALTCLQACLHAHQVVQHCCPAAVAGCWLGLFYRLAWCHPARQHMQRKARGMHQAAMPQRLPTSYSQRCNWFLA